MWCMMIASPELQQRYLYKKIYRFANNQENECNKSKQGVYAFREDVWVKMCIGLVDGMDRRVR
jgi:hypothetical protein